MDYIICGRQVARGGFGGRSGPACFLAVPMSAHTPLPEHETAKMVWINHLREMVAPEESIITLIHGLTLGPRDMLARHRRFRRGLEAQGHKGVIVSFDWPAMEGSVPGLCMQEGVDQAAEIFAVDGFFATSAMISQTAKHIVAHSTGCEVLRRAFACVDARQVDVPADWSVDHVALVAADVSSSALAARNPASGPLYLHARRVANYYSHFDEVLSQSDIEHSGSGPRAGRIGLRAEQPSCAVDVHCGPFFDAQRGAFADTEAGTHEWYFHAPQFYKDLLGMIQDRTGRPSSKSRALQMQGADDLAGVR